MSTFNRFCAKARRAAECVSQKAGELVDSASKSVKLKSLEIRLDELYESLGRVIYRDLHTDDDLEEQKLELIAAIDALYDEIAVLKADKAAAADDAEEDAEEPEAQAPSDGE